MWIIFLLKYICEKMKKGTFGVLLHSKYFKTFSKSRMQLSSHLRYKCVTDGSLLNSEDLHTVFAGAYLQRE